MARSPDMWPTLNQVKIECHPHDVWLVIGFQIIRLDEDVRVWLAEELAKARPTRAAPAPSAVQTQDVASPSP